MAMGKKARIAATAVVLVALGIFVPPSINVNRYKSRIAGAIESAIGHPVTVGGVALRLLPQPGFTLSNLIVADDPAFSAEPMLRSEEVIASLRLSSLWRGRLEIAKLTLKEPSLNLVRSPAGTWNIESLLIRAAQTPSAPTAKVRPEARTRFPYIEAENGRINFKVGPVKKVYALTDADFALWLASENEWHTRLDARPVRNDASLSDTGRLRIDGTLQRSTRLAETPLQFRIRLQDAQLGQLSTLIYGRDRGWRGNTNVILDLTGSATNLILTADATVAEFRRYDITPRDSLALQAHCVARYSANSDALRNLGCTLPTGDGEFTVRGNITGLADNPQYDLGLVAREVPLSYAVAFIRRAKKDLPDDLTADGILNAAFAVRSESQGLAWSGGGNTQQLRLRSQGLDPALDIGTVAFVAEPMPAPNIPALTTKARGTPRGASRKTSTKGSGFAVKTVAEPAANTGYQLSVERFNVALGATQPGSAHAVFVRDGYDIEIAGPAELARLLQLARALGIAAPAAVASGAARVQLRVAGTWPGFPQPVITGNAELRDASVQVPGIEGPIQFTAADVSLNSDELRVENLTASLGGSVMLAGWIRKPRACAVARECVAEFSLRSDHIGADDLDRLLNPKLRVEPWYRRIGAATAPPSILSQVRANGKLTVDQFTTNGVTAQNLSATVQIEPGSLRLTQINAEVFGGALNGELRADFSGLQPAYSANGTLQHGSLIEISDAMHDGWATGAIDAGFHLVFAGWTTKELLTSAAGSLDFHWRDGMLRHLNLGGVQAVSRKGDVREDAATAGPLRIKDFRGRGTLRDLKLTIAESRMETPGGIYLVSGTASKGLELDLTFKLNGRQSYAVGGTLEAPRVEAVATPASHPTEMR
jgi:hypothetical protein